jgi:hypothetical protein
MGMKKTLQRIKYSFFWEGLRSEVARFCSTCKECQLTRPVRKSGRASITPVTRPQSSFQLMYGRKPQSPLYILKNSWIGKHQNLQLDITSETKGVRTANVERSSILL